MTLHFGNMQSSKSTIWIVLVILIVPTLSDTCLYVCNSNGSCKSIYVDPSRPGAKSGSCFYPVVPGVPACIGIPFECQECNKKLNCPQAGIEEDSNKNDRPSKLCNYICKNIWIGGCEVFYGGPPRPGKTSGSCSPASLGGECFDTPPECNDCNQELSCSDDEHHISDEETTTATTETISSTTTETETASEQENICEDKEEWCAYKPACNDEDVMIACPKYCKVCERSLCEDKEDWCAFKPDCNEKNVVTACPKYCTACKQKEMLCEDQEKWCAYKPDCNEENVVTACPKHCRACVGPVEPLDCIWGEYGEWSTCSASCDGGARTRTRLAATPAANGGAACSGSSIETEACKTEACPGLNNITLGDCTDTDNGKTDSDGNSCVYYGTHKLECGLYDDDDFKAGAICCFCKESCPITRDSIIWFEWSAWTACKHTDNGPTRRRFRDLVGKISPKFWNNTDCLLNTIVDEDKVSTLRTVRVLYHEVLISAPRAAQVEQCKVEDELHEACHEIPTAELLDWCKDEVLWIHCRKTCNQSHSTIRNYNACIDSEIPCNDGFCLDYDAIGDEKPDCIDQNIDFPYFEQWQSIPGPNGGVLLVNDYLIKELHATAVTIPLTNVPFTNCNKCFGGGSKTREVTVLEAGTNADSGASNEAQTVWCNQHAKYENDVGVNGCAEIEGYLDFGDYMPKELFEVKIPYESGQGDGVVEYIRSQNMVRNWTTPKEAMDVCLNEDSCCGVSYSEGFKWTLRNGGLVNKLDEIDEDTEPGNLFSEEFMTTGIWGISSIRKDCYQAGLSSSSCKDKNPGSCKLYLKHKYKNDMQKFEEEYCTTRENAMKCLKTCRRCYNF